MGQINGWTNGRIAALLNAPTVARGIMIIVRIVLSKFHWFDVVRICCTKDVPTRFNVPGLDANGLISVTLFPCSQWVRSTLAKSKG